MTDLDELRVLAAAEAADAADFGESATDWAECAYSGDVPQEGAGWEPDLQLEAMCFGAAHHARLALALTEAAEEIEALRALIALARKARHAGDARVYGSALQLLWVSIDRYDTEAP